jgi:hypothetical protein
MLSWDNVQPINLSLQAGVDLSAHQYHFVALSSDGKIDPVASAGAVVHGVLQNAPDAADKIATVTTLGVTRVVAAGVINPGAFVQSNANAEAIVAASGDYVAGIYIGSAACAAGDIIPVLIGTTGYVLA